MATPRISIGANRKESLTEMVERYKTLAEPKTIYTGLTFFTLRQDMKLYKMLKEDPTHPKDTGLLKESWIPPVKITGGGITNIQPTEYFAQYRGSFESKKFNVYVLNTATVGQQALRKSGVRIGKRKRSSGKHNLKRYMPFVDKRTQFYSKKLRIVRQQLDKEWKYFVSDYIYERLGVIT